MEHANSLWMFFALTLGVIALPGLDMAFVAGSASARGWQGGAAATAGVVAGGLIHVVVNVTGLAALLMLWPGAFQVLLVVGSAYMAWIGWSMWRLPLEAASAPQPGAQASQLSALPTLALVFRRGVLNCLLNPKAYAFMLAVFPAYLQVPERSVAAQATLLASIIAANQIVVYGGVAAATVGARQWLGGEGRRAGWMTRAVGALLMVAATLTLWKAWA